MDISILVANSKKIFLVFILIKGLSKFKCDISLVDTLINISGFENCFE